MARRGGRGGRHAPMEERYEREEEERNLQQVEDRLAQMLNGRMDALTELLTQRFDLNGANARRNREHREPNPRQEEEEEGGGYDNPFADHGPRRRYHANPNQHQRWDSNVGKEIMEFTGALGPDEFMDWIGITEDVLELKRVSEDMRVPLVTTKFRGRAAAWWQQLKQSRSRLGKTKIDSWEKLKKHMRSSFLPYNYVRTLFQRLQNLKQGSRSIDDYTTEFHQLVARNDLADSDEQLVSRYIGGMSLQFQDTLNLFDPVSVSEAHQRALNLEKQLSRKNNGIWSRGNTSSTSPQRPPQTSTTIGPPPRQYSGAAASGAGFGPVTRSHTIGVTPRCFSCGEQGHRIADCPSKRSERTGKGLFVDNETMEDPRYEEREPIYDEEGCSEEFVEGDKGPLLVLRRTCFTPRITEGDEWLRDHIFRSTCTIGGKVCSIIIDPGSCENVVSQEAVTKLQLPTEQHPKPYRLSWLKKGTLIYVSKRCLVPFSIGSIYKDKVWCDVVEMDACHLLLGRPWEFDVSAIHDGRQNTYAFVFENCKIVLLPSREITMKGSRQESSSLLTKQQLVEEVSDTGIMCVLIGARNDIRAEIPKRVRPLLHEFETLEDSSAHKVSENLIDACRIQAEPDCERLTEKEFDALQKKMCNTEEKNKESLNEKEARVGDEQDTTIVDKHETIIVSTEALESVNSILGGKMDDIREAKTGMQNVISTLPLNDDSLIGNNSFREKRLEKKKKVRKRNLDDELRDTTNSRSNSVQPGEDDADEMALRYMENFDRRG